MNNKEFLMLDMLSIVYEEMDIDAVEEKLVNMVSEIFSFDRVALFFVKHRKEVLQGKLCKGFEPGTISSIVLPIAEQYAFTRPLVSGFPLWGSEIKEDRFTRQIGLTHFAVIPIINQKRTSCWQLKNCAARDCPAYGKQWVRCWLVPDTGCCDGAVLSAHEKSSLCEKCTVFTSQKTQAIEGILLVDNSLTKREIDEKTITILSIIAHAVGVAINNSKVYSHALRDAIIDDLTGLHNRKYFNERLLDEVDRARRYGGDVSLLMCDVDYFKQVNDTYGHPTGDRVLKMIGRHLHDKLRKTDIVARCGGEEFGVVLLNTGRKEAVRMAETLRSLVAESTLPGEEDIRVTISIGVSALGEDINTFEGLINASDKALYMAKSQGRNKVCQI